MTEPTPAASPLLGSSTHRRGAGTAVVVAGGDSFDPGVLRRLPGHRTVFAADSGLDSALAAGLEVDVVVGDLDSVDPAALAAAERAGTSVERHPVDKDHTDLDLTLLRVAAEGFTRCIVLGGGGGRLSHLLANAALVAAARHADLDIVWFVGASEVHVARPGRRVEVAGAPGDLVSLLAVGGTATGVTTTGLRWRLRDNALETGSTRGVSNELTGLGAAVSVDSGALLVVHEPAEPGSPS